MKARDNSTDGRTPEEFLLSLEEVAAMLGVCKRTVRRFYERGELPRPKRMGPKLLRFFKGDVEAYLHRLREP